MAKHGCRRRDAQQQPCSWQNAQNGERIGVALDNSTEAESEETPAGYIDEVFLMGARAPAVIPANPHLLHGAAHHRVVNRRKLVSVCSVFQLMRSIGQRRKGHIPVRLEAQAPAAIVHDFRPAHAGARAALLRYEITGQIVLRRCFKNSQPCPRQRSL